MGNPATYFLLFCFFYISNGDVFRIPLERRQKRSLSGDHPGSLTLKNLRNEEYWGSITIGTPPQKFEAMFGTGAHTTWVPNKRCYNCKSGNKFDEDKSSTYTDLNRTTSVNYYIGHMNGICGKDTINVAGIEVKDQEMATATKAAFIENIFDGIVGLAFTPKRSGALKSFVENLLEQKKLERNIISFYMKRNGDLNDGGELIIGGWNEELFDSKSIDYIPTATDSHDWQITIDSMYLGEEKMPCNGCVGIADTGNTMITGPKRILNPYFAKMNAKKKNRLYFVNCTSIPSLPDLTFVINEIRYTLKGEDYIFKDSSDPESCLVGISPSINEEYVLGIVFLAKYYSIFNIENKTVAFAPLKIVN